MHKLLLYLSFPLLLLACGKPAKPSVAELRAEKHKNDSLALVQHQRSVAYADSMLFVMEQRRDSLLPLFEYGKDERYQDVGRYVHRRFNLVRNMERCHLEMFIDDNRNLSVCCHYVGSFPLAAHSLQLSNDSLTLTHRGSNHAFTTDERYFERLSFEGEPAVELLRFFSINPGGKYRAQIIGDKGKYRYLLSPEDIAAIADTYHFYLTLTDIHQLELQLAQHTEQTKKYKKRVEK